MTAGLGPYLRMKHSGVPWLADVPEHWSVTRLKRLFREVDRRSGTGQEPLLSLRMKQGLVDHHRAGGKYLPPSVLTHYKLTEPGELVMNRMRASAGLFAATPSKGLVSPDYAVLRPRVPLELRYFEYLFKTPQMMSVFRLESRGLGTGESGFLRLYTDRFGMLPAVLPHLDEQRVIVRFLDHADRRIRRYIRAKQRLIKLLEEQKQAIIHRAVTRGLNPNVRLKPSGVEWLGDLPEHWKRCRLKAVLRAVDARTLTGSEKLLSLRRNVGIVYFADHFSRPPQAASLVGYKQVEPGQIVVNRLQANNGLIFRSDVAGLTSPDYSVFDVAKETDPEYLARLLRSPIYRDHFRRVATGLGTGSAGFLRLYDDALLETPVWLPPKHEQLQSVRRSDEATLMLQRALVAAESSMSLMQEYRTGMLSDVVTGKLDVREAAAHLPDEADDVARLDEVERAADEESQDAFDELVEEAEA